METAIATRPTGSQGGLLLPSTFADAIAFAELMCKASLVPAHLQGKPADCLLVIEQAQRWGLSPFAVAACTSVIQGKLMFEGKLVAAVINAKGDLEERLKYDYANTGDARVVTVAGRLRGEKELRTVSVRMADARTNNRMWQMQPDQQLAYHGARVWARRHMPELMLGVYSPEEFSAPAEVVSYDSPKASSTSAPSVPPSEGAAVRSTGRAAAGVNRDGSFDVEREEVADDDGLEMVDIYDMDTGEAIRTEPKLTDGQFRKLHALRNELRNVMNDEKFRKRLVRTFSKDSSTLLSKSEAARLIDALEKMAAKAQKKLDNATASIAADLQAMQDEEREPGSEG